MNYFDDLSFVNFGHAKKSDSRAEGRFFEGYYGIQFLYRGSMYARTGNNPLEYADEPSVFITFPGPAFDYGSPEGKLRSHAYVCFRGERVKRYLSDGLMTPRETQLFRRLRNPEGFFRQMCNLFQMLRVPGDVPHARAVLLLEDLLVQIQEQPMLTEKLYNRYMNDLLSLRDRIAMKPLLEWDFRQEAGRMGLSYVHFRRIFKQTVGLAPGAFLLECRLRHAEELLVSSHVRIADAALECRFNDVYHFSRIFKKHCGHSPTEFRQLYGTR